MRLVGELNDEARARTFGDYLTHLGIENRVVDEEDGQYEIWVHWEDELERAETLLEKFLANPDDEEYKGVTAKADKARKKARREARKAPPRMDARTTIFNRGGPTPRGRLTPLLIVICIGIGIFSKLGRNIGSLDIFFITKLTQQGGYIYWLKGLPEIMTGEIWRIFTPMFIHFGFMHLVFNMMWLWDLGNMVEYRKGSVFLALFILTSAGVGNLAQFFWSGPLFGGMSGVVYGLLGYIWIKGKYDPASGLWLHRTTVVFMMVWFFLCLIGAMGSIANGAHAGGLITGMVWGFLGTDKPRQLLRKLKAGAKEDKNEKRDE